jgi:hypothetical protein
MSGVSCSGTDRSIRSRWRTGPVRPVPDEATSPRSKASGGAVGCATVSANPNSLTSRWQPDSRAGPARRDPMNTPTRNEYLIPTCVRRTLTCREIPLRLRGDNRGRVGTSWQGTLTSSPAFEMRLDLLLGEIRQPETLQRGVQHEALQC